MVGASRSATMRSSSAATGPKPCGRCAGSLAVQAAIRSHTECGTPALPQRLQIQRLVQDAVEDPLDRVAADRLRAGDQLEQQDAERVDIHLLGDALPGHLLRRHVVRRAQHVPGARHLHSLRSWRCRNPSASPRRRRLMWMFSGLMSRWMIFWRVDVFQRARHLQRDLQFAASGRRCGRSGWRGAGLRRAGTPSP